MQNPVVGAAGGHRGSGSNVANRWLRNNDNPIQPPSHRDNRQLSVAAGKHNSENYLHAQITDCYISGLPHLGSSHSEPSLRAPKLSFKDSESTLASNIELDVLLYDVLQQDQGQATSTSPEFESGVDNRGISGNYDGSQASGNASVTTPASQGSLNRHTFVGPPIARSSHTTSAPGSSLAFGQAPTLPAATHFMEYLPDKHEHWERMMEIIIVLLTSYNWHFGLVTIVNKSGPGERDDAFGADTTTMMDRADFMAEAKMMFMRIHGESDLMIDDDGS